MATIVTLNGTNYSIPAYGDINWASGAGNLSSFLVAIPSSVLQPTGGNFTLTGNVNFGSSFGLIAKFFEKSDNSPLLGWYSVAFTSQSSVVVTHNLGHQPIVQVLDQNGNVIQPDSINHQSANAFTVNFSPAMSGTIIYAG